MNQHRCWRCDRSLNVEKAPDKEDVIIRCPRCKASNIVRAGKPAEPQEMSRAY